MPAKKKAKKVKGRFVPQIKTSVDYTNVQSLETGDCFLYQGNIYMKEFDGSVGLETGEFTEEIPCGTPVEPIEIKIHWKKVK